MILASKSPRRKEILENIGFNIKIIPSLIEEISDLEKLEDRIKDIARKKALDVSRSNPNDYVVAADTVVVLEDKVLGKPSSIDEAKEFLTSLSGREHKVITAFSLIHSKQNIDISDLEVSYVKFKNLSEEILEWYLSTDEYKDKAGAYGIQAKGAVLVEGINGDFFNIMGFPISKFMSLLEELNIDINKIDNI